MPSASSTYVGQAPSAVNTSFTYTGGGAGEAQLYDFNDATPAADPVGVNMNTHAAYDFGSAKDIRRIRAITATQGGGFTNSMTVDIGYSDTSLTTGFTNFTTMVVPAGTGQSVTADFASQGAHRYWRIYYKSGTTTFNGWLGDLDMYTLE